MSEAVPLIHHGADSENVTFTLHKVFIKSAVFESILHCIHVVITDGCCSECDSYIRSTVTWYIICDNCGLCHGSGN
jgi:hypothetical protein